MKTAFAEPSYTHDWFTAKIPFFEQMLSPYKGVEVSALEVGSYEGRSAVWLFENVLTHPQSHLVSVDARALHTGALHNDRYTGEVYERFKLNLAPFSDKLTEVIGDSRVEMALLLPQSFDFVYIDGRHAYSHVLFDAVHAWDLVKKDGLIIFDDAFEDGVRNALTSFCQAVKGQYEYFKSDWQVALRKTP